eukprot:3154995-Rhodomonas_salina.1
MDSTKPQQPRNRFSTNRHNAVTATRSQALVLSAGTQVFAVPRDGHVRLGKVLRVPYAMSSTDIAFPTPCPVLTWAVPLPRTWAHLPRRSPPTATPSCYALAQKKPSRVVPAVCFVALDFAASGTDAAVHRAGGRMSGAQHADRRCEVARAVRGQLQWLRLLSRSAPPPAYAMSGTEIA